MITFHSRATPTKTYSLLYPEHRRVDRHSTLLLYFRFFLLSKLFEFATKGEKQNDCLDGLGDEIQKLKTGRRDSDLCPREFVMATNLSVQANTSWNSAPEGTELTLCAHVETKSEREWAKDNRTCNRSG